jgi:mRNA interferase MazF
VSIGRIPAPELIFRGDVYHANLSPTTGHEQDGIRPVVVVSVDEGNRGGVVTIVPFTSQLQQVADYMPRIERRPGSGLDLDSWALCHQSRAISVGRLVMPKRGMLRPEQMRLVDDALRYYLGLEVTP